MEAQATAGLLRFFQVMPDPRASNASHRLSDVMAIAIMAVLCGSQGWVAVEAWGRLNSQWLATFLELPHGIPTHDTFDRVFAAMNPTAFERCFTTWTSALVGNAKGLFVAVDGKTLRRSFKRSWSKTPVHLVSAFAAKNNLILGQLATDCKSNEITAIPKLLAMLEIAGSTVTIDAMGCQREIAQQIIDQKADYVLAVKDNQPNLYRAVQAVMNEIALGGPRGVPWMRHGYFEQSADTNNHGRVETRRVWVSDQIDGLGADLLKLWPGLAALVMVETVRQDLADLTGHVSTERRYYITSRRGTDAELLADAIRSHWGIENALHWCLDVSMREDDSRIRVDNGAENFSRLRRIAVNKLKQCEIKKENGKVLKTSIKIKQQACGWSREFLLQALLA
jgi:predicted transposase YbfD/YdcC